MTPEERERIDKLDPLGRGIELGLRVFWPSMIFWLPIAIPAWLIVEAAVRIGEWRDRR